jgi:hypothetical protein
MGFFDLIHVPYKDSNEHILGCNNKLKLFHTFWIGIGDVDSVLSLESSLSYKATPCV